jgi:hypothetical protein
LDGPHGASPTLVGGIVWTESAADIVRAAGPDGIVTVVAGRPGRPGKGGDGGPAFKAELNFPNAVVATPDGGYLIADTRSNNIRFVDAKGVISTVAGRGSAGYSGDGGPAVGARLRGPLGVAALPDGSFLIADTGNNVVRRVSSDGRITTVAGFGPRGYAGDGGKATSALLWAPYAVAPTPDGGFLVSDTGNHRVRKVAPDGTITTVAGDGTRGDGGDGGPATKAELVDPRGIAVLPNGGFLVADSGDNRVRQIAPDGTINTFAGTGTAGAAGDGGEATSAQLAGPESVALTSSGGVLIADAENNRIRLVGAPVQPRNVALPTIAGNSSLGGTLFAAAGGWHGTGPAIGYRWLRCDVSGLRCVPIPGGVDTSYRVQGRDFGSTLRVRVTATNAAGAATATSLPVGIGRLERKTFFLFGSKTDDAVVLERFQRGKPPKAMVRPTGSAIVVMRSRTSVSLWQASVGVLRYDTSTLGGHIRPESVTLFLAVLDARTDDKLSLVVRGCPASDPASGKDFAPAKGGTSTLVPIRTVRRGIFAIPLTSTDVVDTRGPTALCLFVSGGVPHGRNLVSFVSREGSRQRAAILVVTYRVR